MIETLSILTFVSILIINLGTFRGNEFFVDTGTILLVIIVVFGWMILGVFRPNANTSEYKLSKYNIEKTKIGVIVRDSTLREFIFDKKIDFDNITDTTTFYLNTETNMYGFNSTYYVFYYMKGVKNKSIKI